MLVPKSVTRLTCASGPLREIYSRYSDRLVYSIPYDTAYGTDPVPVGIDVSDSILMTKYHLYADSCAIGIGAKSENLKEVEFFIDYILGEAKK